MERKSPDDRSKTWTLFRRVRLYRDELDAIFKIVCSIDADASAETEAFKDIKSTKEFAETDKERVSRFRLATTDGRLVVTLGRSTQIYIQDNDDNELVGALNRLRGILDQARSNGLGYRVFVFVFGLALAVGLGGIGTLLPAVAGFLFPIWFIITMFAFVQVVELKPVNALFPHSTLVRVYRSEAPTFWQRNGSSILIGAVVNLLTSTLFYFIGVKYG